MIIERASILTGVIRKQNLPITQDQIDDYNNGFKHLAEAFHQCTPAQREFYMTGITADEWKEAFSKL